MQTREEHIKYPPVLVPPDPPVVCRIQPGVLWAHEYSVNTTQPSNLWWQFNLLTVHAGQTGFNITSDR